MAANTRIPFGTPVWMKGVGGALAVLLLIFCILGWYWSREPDVFWVNAQADGERKVVGYAITDTMIRVSETLLDKPGGYLTNDVIPPSVILDNIPNWEFGVLQQLRDLSTVMRNDFSRSQSQSKEDPDLTDADPRFNIDSEAWIFPAAESEYRDAISSVESYRDRLVGVTKPQAQFYSRADNLREWLAQVEKRLGSLSRRLGESVGDRRINTAMAGDPDAESNAPQPDSIDDKTSWFEIDDIFYESRGTAWALVHLLRAAELDFASVLEKKNARESLRQIIRELENSLQPISSPIILNGKGYGMFANHSLVMANYLARANAAVINLRELLDQG